MTGLQTLADAKIDLQVFAGEDFELRCVGASEDMRLAFERSGWKLMDAMGECSSDFVAVGYVDVVFGSMPSEVVAGRVEGVACSGCTRRLTEQETFHATARHVHSHSRQCRHSAPKINMKPEFVFYTTRITHNATHPNGIEIVSPHRQPGFIDSPQHRR